MLSFSLLLSMGISVNLEEASAQNRSIPNDMQAIRKDIGESLSRLTSTNSSNLLSKTMILINETASRLANETSDIANDGSFQQAEIIGKKLAIGIAKCLEQHKWRSKTGIRDQVINRNDPYYYVLSHKIYRNLSNFMQLLNS